MKNRTSVQQAACNAFAAYLKECAVFDGMCVDVQPRWVESAVAPKQRRITVIHAGARQTEWVDPYVIEKVADETGQLATFRWMLAHCVQPLQLDVWTTSDIAQDDMVARLDDALNVGNAAIAGLSVTDPIAATVNLKLLEEDGWGGTIAAFFFGSPNTDPTPDTVRRAEWRAMYTGEARFNLTTIATSPKLARATLKQFLHETDTAPEGLASENIAITATSITHTTG